MMWRKVKALLRKAQAHNHPDLLAAIASALSAVTPQDSLGWFTHCGYSFVLNALGFGKLRAMRDAAALPIR
jgi:hypothetical protein